MFDMDVMGSPLKDLYDGRSAAGYSSASLDDIAFEVPSMTLWRH
jgi:hypothetical protein